MSYREEKFLSFKKSDLIPKLSYMDEMSAEDIADLFKELLDEGIYGFCFSLYEEGQGPGDIIPREQIARRMEIVAPHTTSIRSFSCTDGNELIPQVAKEFGLKTLVGAWLGDDEEKNEEEIQNLIQLAKDGYVDVAAVGNEVLYRNDLTEEQLLEKIAYVKNELDGIVPVGYVDAYYEFVHRPAITELCDILLCNCYPFWEGTSISDSFHHMRQMYYQVKNVANGKEVMITETGWPSKGSPLGGAVPSKENAIRYFINANLWSQDEDIDIFYFSSFDESWKVGAEGEVGAYWGIWDKNGKLKY
ncbi:MAG: glycosyl hydrolase family 17 protein [Gracilimonas sp.]|jgi:exo-beta-1,3-glucanase (GH17 family)|nr:glycosyl hydrolase family 17 protein [Gracilimonas sp.]